MTSLFHRRESTVWEERQVGQHRGPGYACIVQTRVGLLGPLNTSFSFSVLETFGFSLVYPRSLPYKPEISPLRVSKSIFQGVYSACLTRSLTTCPLPLIAAVSSSACLSRCTADSLTGKSFGR